VNKRGISPPEEALAIQSAYETLASLNGAGRRRALLQLAAQLGVHLEADVEKATRPVIRKDGPGRSSGFYESSSGA
jgi:hypothetical protein